MENKDIDFIARHYREGRFLTDSAWRSLGVMKVSRRKRFRVAAVAAVMVILSASAAIIYNEYHVDDTQSQRVNIPVPDPLVEVKVIDFENASLMDVVRKIESVYNVKVENLPDQDEKFELSLHYEGTPGDLIEVINDILGTQMVVVEK